MTANLSAYLPQDRRRALARGESLPNRTIGTALFADISGFTALTEQLRHTLGPRRGIEALTSQIDIVYTALIAEIERHGGSVISFAGDAVMCWFNDKEEGRSEKAEGSSFFPRPSAFLAVACGLAMQTAMSQFPQLGLKIAIATGPARRFVVGNPQIYYLDALAGATISRTAAGERLANKGEVLVDQAIVQQLGTALTISEGRADSATGAPFAVVAHLDGTVALPRRPEMPPLEPTQLQAWLHPLVYTRELSETLFLAEFRPCAAVFIRFAGIDYDHNAAQARLDAFIRQAQRVTRQYQGLLVDLTIGDKGSYLYLNFGAIMAHEDAPRRAVKAALTLQRVTADNPDLNQLQIGITYGVMRVGAYGGANRRTYGALGDDVNLAARLMGQAAPGEILVSKRIQKATTTDFTFVTRSAVQFKGKAEPVPVFLVTGRQRRHAIRRQEPTYALPMVGRQAELKTISDKMALAQQGSAQVAAIIAEAGLGKSRLVAEVIRLAYQKGFASYGGACQSDATSTPYHAWKNIWRAFFDVGPETPLPQLMRQLEAEIEVHAPLRVAAIPLLNLLLGTKIPENDFTQTLEPKIRQSALHALLEDCLKAAAQEEPLLIVIEDMHWIDALSYDLLAQLVQATAKLPICFVLAYRPPQLPQSIAWRLERLPQFMHIQLHALPPDQAEQVIRGKLAQLYPRRDNTLPAELVETLVARAQGNPFYLEELLNYVRDQGLHPTDLDQIELPDSLHALILSRIDQLNEREKRTLRVAGIIGRLFRADWLLGYYPELGIFSQVKAALDRLHILDITPLESPEPDLSYLFKHIITHEVTYESLPFATRAQLHERLAAYLERVYAEAVPLETLAFHYGRSDNKAKQIEYLRRAGEAAQKNFAGDAALNFYGTLLPLLLNDQEKFAIHLQRGQVLELMGKWEEAESDYRAALALVPDSAEKKGGAQFALGKLTRLRGEYETALNWLTQAREMQAASDDSAGLAETEIEMGTVWLRQGNYAAAHEQFNKGLALAQETGDTVNVALALNNLGIAVLKQGDYGAAQALFEESLGLRRERGDKWGISASLNNLGMVTLNQGDYTAARALLKESLSLEREMGDKQGISGSLQNLGVVALRQGDYVAAQNLYEESLSLRREMGDKQGIAVSLNNLGLVADNQGDYAAARALYGESLSLKREMGDKQGIASSLNNLGVVVLQQGDFAAARALHEECLSLRRELGDKRGVAESLNNLGYLNLAQADSSRAYVLFIESLTLNQEMGLKSEIVGNLIGLAAVAGVRGNNGRSVHLAAAAETLRVSVGVALLPLQRDVYGKAVTTTQAALAEEAFAAAWAEGERMTLEEVVNYALGETAVSI